MKIYFYRVILLLVFFCLPINAQETLPPFHWANEYIDYLKVSGKLPELVVSHRPYDRITLAKAFLEMDLDNATASEKEMVELLYRELAPEMEILGSIPGSKWKSLLEKALRFLKIKLAPDWQHPAVKLGAFGETGFSNNDEIDFNNPDLHYQTQAGLYWRDRVSVYSSLAVFNNVADNYIGKEYNSLYAINQQAYIRYANDWFQAKVGRDYFQLGPGRNGQLLFSDNSQPFDMYHFMLNSRAIQFSFWGIQLDQTAILGDETRVFIPIHRYINGHRLSLNLGDKFFFGVTEAVLYSGVDRPWELGFMNPLALYYAYNSNFRTTIQPGNLFYSIDWDLYLRPNLEIYGEIMLDDIQVDNEVVGDLEPNEYGLILGLNWANPLKLSGGIFGFEYTQVRNRTYNVQDPRSDKYLHRREEIGHHLGNNFESFGASYKHWLRPDLQLKVFADLVRQGEGSVEGVFNTDFLNATVEEGYEEAFPFGVVERKTSYGASIFFKPHPAGHLFLEASQNEYDNFEHFTDATFSDFRVRGGFWLQWSKLWQW